MQFMKNRVILKSVNDYLAIIIYEYSLLRMRWAGFYLIGKIKGTKCAGGKLFGNNTT